MFKETCEVLENKTVAPGHFVMKLRSKKIGKTALPGQFVQILCSGDSMDPLLPRPFSFLEASASDFSILYNVVGQGTGLMAKFKKGDKTHVLGPLGKGFTLRRKKEDGRGKRLLVGGGVGIPPLYHLAENLVRAKEVKKTDIHVFLGARNKSLLLCEKDFAKLGIKMYLATDDGTKGHKGFVTQILVKFLKSSISHLSSSLIHCCGPIPMLKAVSLVASEFGVPNEASVEVPMACGFGACLGCAIKVRTDVGAGLKPAPTTAPNYRFAIACTEGPVFEGSKILWD